MKVLGSSLSPILQVLGVLAPGGVVMLGLMGACTSCPAAPSTMEDGLEKALRDLDEEICQKNRHDCEASRAQTYLK